MRLRGIRPARNASRPASTALRIAEAIKTGFCAAAMAGKLIRNLSEKLPVEGACPCLWWRAAICAAEMAGELIRNLSEKLLLKGLAPVFGVEPEKHSAREKHSESRAHKKRRNPKVPPQKVR